MDYMDYWRLLEKLTLEQATLLIVGQDPDNVLDTRGYHPVANAIEAALRSNTVKGIIQFQPDYKMRDSKGQPTYKTPASDNLGLSRAVPSAYHDKDLPCYGDLSFWEVDHGKTTVDVESLKGWLQSHGFKSGFFFPDNAPEPDYMSPEHPRYSAKLAAAVKVWQAMDDDNLYSGKSPREGMSNWLESHYKELGLVWNNKINKTGIKEVTKVANWITAGGAPTTPSNE